MKVEINKEVIENVFAPIFALAEKANPNLNMNVHMLVNKALAVLQTPVQEQNKEPDNKKKKGGK